MKRMLLYGFYGIGNAGNEAMLRAFADGVRDKIAEPIEIVVASRHPSSSYEQHYGVRTVQNLEYATRERSAGRWLRGLNPDDTDEWHAFVRTVATSDLVVVGPGQYIVETGTTGLLKGSLAQLAAVVTACSLTSTPLFGLALACEPLRSAWGKLLVDQLLPAFAVLTFRDPMSVDNLRAAGIRAPQHEVLGDLALLGEAAPPESATEALEAEGIPPARGARLAWAPREIYWLEHDAATLRQRMARTLSLWLECDPVRDVLAIAQSVYDIDGPRDDDRRAAEAVVARVPEELRSRIHLMRGSYDPAVTEALYAGCDVTLSARLHGSVFSCKQGTPPLVFSFMDKTRGFFERIDHPQCLVDLEDEPAVIVDRLEAVLADRDRLAASITEQVARTRTSAQGYVDTTMNLLREPGSSRHRWAQQVLG